MHALSHHTKLYFWLLALALVAGLVFGAAPSSGGTSHTRAVTARVHSATARAQQSDWPTILDQYNRAFRLPLGLPPAASNDQLVKAAQNHADYIAAGGEFGHTEDPSRPGYTGRLPWDRCQAVGGPICGEIVSGDPNLERVMAGGWVNAPYHALLLFKSAEIGCASSPAATVCDLAGDDSGSIDTSNVEAPANAPDSPVRLWPYDGASGIPTRLQGGESPDPLANYSGDHNNVGPTVYAYAGFAPGSTATLTLTDTTGIPVPLLAGGGSSSETQVLIRRLSASDDAWHFYFPTKVLLPGTRYTLTFAVDGGQTRTASFTTAGRAPAPAKPKPPAKPGQSSPPSSSNAGVLASINALRASLHEAPLEFDSAAQRVADRILKAFRDDVVGGIDPRWYVGGGNCSICFSVVDDDNTVHDIDELYRAYGGHGVVGAAFTPADFAHGGLVAEVHRASALLALVADPRARYLGLDRPAPGTLLFAVGADPSRSFTHPVVLGARPLDPAQPFLGVVIPPNLRRARIRLLERRGPTSFALVSTRFSPIFADHPNGLGGIDGGGFVPVLDLTRFDSPELRLTYGDSLRLLVGRLAFTVPVKSLPPEFARSGLTFKPAASPAERAVIAAALRGAPREYRRLAALASAFAFVDVRSPAAMRALAPFCGPPSLGGGLACVVGCGRPTPGEGPCIRPLGPYRGRRYGIYITPDGVRDRRTVLWAVSQLISVIGFDGPGRAAFARELRQLPQSKTNGRCPVIPASLCDNDGPLLYDQLTQFAIGGHARSPWGDRPAPPGVILRLLHTYWAVRPYYLLLPDVLWPRG